MVGEEALDIQPQLVDSNLDPKLGPHTLECTGHMSAYKVLDTLLVQDSWIVW